MWKATLACNVVTTHTSVVRTASMFTENVFGDARNFEPFQVLRHVGADKHNLFLTILTKVVPGLIWMRADMTVYQPGIFLYNLLIKNPNRLYNCSKQFQEKRKCEYYISSSGQHNNMGSVSILHQQGPWTRCHPVHCRGMFCLFFYRNMHKNTNFWYNDTVCHLSKLFEQFFMLRTIQSFKICIILMKSSLQVLSWNVGA